MNTADLITEIVTVYIPQVVTIASMIVAVTPTDWDNRFLARAVKFIRLFGLNVGRATPKD